MHWRPPLEMLFFLLIMIVAAMVQGLSGFGTALICISILPYIMDYKVALPIIYIASGTINLLLVLKMHRNIQWKLLIMPVFFSLLGRFAGMLLFTNLESNVLIIILGILIISISTLQLTILKKIKIKPNHKNGAIAGLLSGILGGISGAGGPPIVLYYMNLGLNKHEYISTVQMTFLVGSLFSILLMAMAGNYTAGNLTYAAVAVAGVLIGTFIGQKIFDFIKQDHLQKSVNYVLLAMGLSLIIKVIL